MLLYMRGKNRVVETTRQFCEMDNLHEISKKLQAFDDALNGRRSIER
jgi:hypothetical protein